MELFAGWFQTLNAKPCSGKVSVKAKDSIYLFVWLCSYAHSGQGKSKLRHGAGINLQVGAYVGLRVLGLGLHPPRFGNLAFLTSRETEITSWRKESCYRSSSLAASSLGLPQILGLGSRVHRVGCGRARFYGTWFSTVSILFRNLASCLLTSLRHSHQAILFDSES